MSVIDLAAVRRDKGWGDKFEPRVRELIGPHLLSTAPLHRDWYEATDLMGLRGHDLQIAVRVRRHGPAQAAQWVRTFSLRSHRDTGTKTELSKIVDGWGDWLFYGHATRDERDITPWFLIDLDAFRAHLIRRTAHRIRMGVIQNGDGTGFSWFDVDTFASTPKLLVAEGR